MSKNALLQHVEDLTTVKEYPNFKAGDTITVTYKIKKVIKKGFKAFRESFYKEPEVDQLKLLL